MAATAHDGGLALKPLGLPGSAVIAKPGIRWTFLRARYVRYKYPHVVVLQIRVGGAGPTLALSHRTIHERGPLGRMSWALEKS